MAEWRGEMWLQGWLGAAQVLTRLSTLKVGNHFEDWGTE